MTTEDSTADTALLKGRYRLGELIGTGGLAGVYRAHDEFLGRDVAVKIFRASASAEIDFRRQEDEVNVLARLSHPNLVTLLDAAVDRSVPEEPRIYYVMELVEGTDLERRIREGSLTPRQIAQLGYYVASALELVHYNGIVHRDIKPSNILLASYLDDDSRIVAKLTDFGIASIGDAAPIAENEIVTGTVAYFSPEQSAGELVTAASDIYSLGLVLLQCFTGELAFPGPPQHSALVRQLDDPPMPEVVPEDWIPLLRAMTARDPAERPDGHEVALALREMFAAEIGRHRRDDSPAGDAAAAKVDSEFTARGGVEMDRIIALAVRVLRATAAIVRLERDDLVWVGPPGVAVDSRALDPAGAGEQGFAFSARVPLRSADGRDLGILAVLDVAPRDLGDEEQAILDDLAAIAVREIELFSAGPQGVDENVFELAPERGDVAITGRE